jgi:hypothetical protein
MASLKKMFLPYVLPYVIPAAAIGVAAGGAFAYYKNFMGLKDKIDGYVRNMLVGKLTEKFTKPFGLPLLSIKGLFGK